MNKETEKAIVKLKSDIAVLENYLNTRSIYKLDHCFETELIKDLYLAITALEAQKSDMWIPISSGRMPDNYTEVYVTTSMRGSYHLFYANNEYRFGNYSGDPIIDRVIAWMPFYIPEPWKEEQ